MGQYHTKNETSVDRQNSPTPDIFTSGKKENSKSSPISLPHADFIKNHSTPSRRDELSKKVTNQIRQQQHDRYMKYSYRLEQCKNYSLTISSNDIECHGGNCQPSLFIQSYPCRSITNVDMIDRIETSPLMNDQCIKKENSYLSLTDLSNIIDHEPNVSRKNSISRSASHILLHKPSLFLRDLLSK